MVAGAGAVEGERRQLTVMFCDLVDSTQPSTSGGPHFGVTTTHSAKPPKGGGPHGELDYRHCGALIRSGF